MHAGRRGAAEQRLDARQQFADVERLGEVVVGAKLEADDAVHDLAAGAQHQDRRRHAPLPERAAHVVPVAARQHPVENDEVEGARGRRRKTGVAVADRRHAVAFGLEAVRQRQHEARLVFDQEHASAGGLAIQDTIGPAEAAGGAA